MPTSGFERIYVLTTNRLRFRSQFCSSPSPPKGLWHIPLSSAISLPLTWRLFLFPDFAERMVNEEEALDPCVIVLCFCILFCFASFLHLKTRRGPRFSPGIMEWAGFNYCWRAGTKGYPTVCDLIWHWTLKLRIMDCGTRYNRLLLSQSREYRI